MFHVNGAPHFQHIWNTNGNANSWRRDLPLLPLASAFLLMSVSGIANQLSSTEHAPASPTPLTGSKQLGWPLRIKKKKKCQRIWLDQLAKQALWFLVPPKAQSLGSSEHCKLRYRLSRVVFPLGLSSTCPLIEVRNAAKTWQVFTSGWSEWVVDPWYLGETSRTLMKDQALG